jgi:hypothetical protein
MHIVKDNGSGWLRWLLKQGGVILAYPKHKHNRCALELLFARQDILHLAKKPRTLLISQRGKGRYNTDGPIFIIYHLKSNGREWPATLAFLVFSFNM